MAVQILRAIIITDYKKCCYSHHVCCRVCLAVFACPQQNEVVRTAGDIVRLKLLGVKLKNLDRSLRRVYESSGSL